MIHILPFLCKKMFSLNIFKKFAQLASFLIIPVIGLQKNGKHSRIVAFLCRLPDIKCHKWLFHSVLCQTALTDIILIFLSYLFIYSIFWYHFSQIMPRARVYRNFKDVETPLGKYYFHIYIPFHNILDAVISPGNSLCTTFFVS